MFRFTIFILFTIVSTQFFAQKSWEIGLKVGVSAPNLRDNSSNIYSNGFVSTTGFNFGIIAERKFDKHYSIAMEANYVKNGGNRFGLQPIPPDFISGAASNPALAALLSQGIPYANFNNSNDLRYIEVPVIFRFNIPIANNSSRIYFGTGLSGSFLIDAINNTTNQSYLYLDQNGTLIPLQPFYPVEIDFTNQRDIKNDLEKFSGSLVFNAGFGINTSRFGELVVDTRGSYGLTAIQKNPVYGTSRIGYVAVSVGYMVYF